MKKKQEVSKQEEKLSKKEEKLSKKEEKLSKPFPLPNLPKTSSQITAHGLVRLPS
jgi:hypothetical protein